VGRHLKPKPVIIVGPDLKTNNRAFLKDKKEKHLEGWNKGRSKRNNKIQDIYSYEIGKTEGIRCVRKE